VPRPDESHIAHILRSDILPVAKQLLSLAQEEWEARPPWMKADRFSYWPHVGRLPGGARLMEDISQAVLKLNPGMLSTASVEREVMHPIARRVAWTTGTNPQAADIAFERELLARLCDLVMLDKHRHVDVPVYYLLVEHVTQVGPVTLYPIENNDPMLDTPFIHADEKSLIHAYARVTSPGDDNTAMQHCLLSVRQALSIIRGVAAPYLARYPIRADFDAMGCVAGPVRATYRFAGQETPLILTAVLALPSKLWGEILAFIGEPLATALLDAARGGFAQKGMKGKILSAFRWLGEAVKPDPVQGRFAKAALALETAVGGESERLTARGITAMLAERAAFLLGEKLEERCQVDEQVRRLYGKRSALFHGDNPNISEDDVQDLVLLAWRVSVTLLERLAEFPRVDSLDEWVVKQRYS